jgi:hypothetical protein
MSEDEDAQKRGLVWIIYSIGKRNEANDINRKLLLQWGAFMRFGAPIRVVGLHFAYNALILKEEAQLLASSLSRAVRLRFVTHHGGKIIYCTRTGCCDRT